MTLSGLAGRLRRIHAVTLRAAMLLGLAAALVFGTLMLRLDQAASVARENAAWIDWTNDFDARLGATLLAVQAAESDEEGLLQENRPGSVAALRRLATDLRNTWREPPPPPVKSPPLSRAIARVNAALDDLAGQIDRVIDLAARDRRAEALAAVSELRRGPGVQELRQAVQDLMIVRRESWEVRQAERRQGLDWSFWIAVALGELALLVLAGVSAAEVRRQRRSEDARPPQAAPAGAGAGVVAAPDRVPPRLIDMIGHDLRQPLQAMSFFAGALESHVARPDGAALLNGLRSAAKSMDRMISGLLDISRLDAGRIVPELRQFPLSEVLTPLRDEFAPLAADKALRLRVEDEPVSVHSDPVLLESVLRNLVSNAVKYTERGQIEVRVRAETQFIWIEVADTGPGIPPGQVKRIFDEYYRGGWTRKTADGLGLGLAVARRLSALLGLTIRVSSEVGRGSLFSVAVPRSGQLVVDPASAVTEPPEASLRGLRILLIDDQPALNEGLRSELQRAGAKVTEAAGPDEACALFETEPPPQFDFALVDRDLGAAMSGLDLLDHLASRYGVALPALVVTADTDPAVIRELRDCDYPWAQKPVSLETVRAWIGKLRAAPASDPAPRERLRVPGGEGG